MQARGKPQLLLNWTLRRAAPYRIHSHFVQNDVVFYRLLQRHKLMSNLSWLTTARERNPGNKRLSRNHIRTATSPNEGITQFDSYFIIGLLDELVLQNKLHCLLVTTMAQTKHNTSRILQWHNYWFLQDMADTANDVIPLCYDALGALDKDQFLLHAFTMCFVYLFPDKLLTASSHNSLAVSELGELTNTTYATTTAPANTCK